MGFCINFVQETTFSLQKIGIAGWLHAGFRLNHMVTAHFSVLTFFLDIGN